jgi:type IV pilus assembly protein PilM
MSIFRHFPAPSYLKIPAFGFDISDRSLKYAKLRRVRREIRLVDFGNKVIPTGLIESGQIKRRDELVSFFKKLRQELKEDYIIASLPEEKIFVGTISLPLMNHREIKGALEAQFEEHIPLSPKEAIFDFEIVREAHEGNHIDVAFTAVPSILIGSYSDVLKEAGFTPLAFETEAHALLRSLISPEEKDNLMIIDFGKTRTSFVITSSQIVGFTSTINIAGEAIDSAIAKELGVSPEESERLKIEQGITPAVLSLISVIKNEAQKHLNYWQSHPDEHGKTREGIEKIILCGGDSNLKGFPEYLSGELKKPVELGNVWLNICSFEEYVPEIEFNDSLKYATALGLALRAI